MQWDELSKDKVQVVVVVVDGGRGSSPWGLGAGGQMTHDKGKAA